MQQAQVLLEPAPRNVRTLCMRCFLKAILKKRDLNWNNPDDLRELADGWGSDHLAWLKRYLDGEIEWLPQRHANALIVLLDLTSSQESIFEKMNRRNFFIRPGEDETFGCHRCSANPPLQVRL